MRIHWTPETPSVYEASPRKPVAVVRVGVRAFIAVSLCAIAPVLAQPPPTSAEIDQLLAAATDNIMYRVAVDRDTVVVGLPYDDRQGERSGTAYVYVRKGERWTRQARLLASDGRPEDQFGFAVAVHGDTVVVGAAADDRIRGSAHVFIRSGNDWRPQAKLLGDDTSQLFGSWVVAGEEIVLVGASDRTRAAAGADVTAAGRQAVAYLFERTGSAWVRRSRFAGLTTPRFGDSADQQLLEKARMYEREKNANATLYMRNGARWSNRVEGCLIGADARGVWLSRKDGGLLFVPHSETDGLMVSGRCSPMSVP